MTDKQWYDEGLRFECTKCGKCCSKPGVVFVTEYEIEKIAERLNLTVERFKEKFVKENQDGLLILNGDHDGPCIFQNKNGQCNIYEVRPNQCWTWPFWPQEINSKERWDAEAKDCPGFNKGELITNIEISSRMAKCNFGYYRGATDDNDE